MLTGALDSRTSVDVARFARRTLRFRDGRVVADKFSSPVEAVEAG